MKAHSGVRAVLAAAFLGATGAAGHSHEMDHESALPAGPPECREPSRPPALRCAPIVTAAFAGNRLWLAWVDRDSVLVNRSEDLGATFSAPVKVGAGPAGIDATGESRPKIVAAPGGNLYVTYTAKGAAPFTGTVLFSRSTDGGKSFSPPKPVAGDTSPDASQRFDALAVDAFGKVVVAWTDKRDAKRADGGYAGAALYVAASADSGATFALNRKIKDHACECCRPALAVEDDGRPLVAWRDIYPPNYRDHSLVKFRSDDAPGGDARVGAETRISIDEWAIDACPHHGPALSIAAAGVYDAAWYSGGGRRTGLFHARSTDGGRSFTAPFAFGRQDRDAAHPAVFSRGAFVIIAWKEFDGTTVSVETIESNDGGKTWSAPRGIAATADASDYPFLLSDGRNVYLSWQTAAEGYRLLPVAALGEGRP